MLIGTLTDILTPLTTEPKNTDPETPKIQDANHFGWVSQFSDLIKIEKEYIKNSNINSDTNSKIEKIFHSFIESMISLGFDVNKDLAWQRTKPLHKAVLEDCKVITTCLIKLGVKIDEYNNSDQTALYEAAWDSNPDMVELLIKNGANVKKENSTGLKYNRLALHVATCPKVIELLVSAGTPVNAICNKPESYTALHLVAQCARPDAIRTLLKLGSVDTQDMNGMTALDLAKTVLKQPNTVLMNDEKKVGGKMLKERMDETVRLLEMYHLEMRIKTATLSQVESLYKKVIKHKSDMEASTI